MPILINNRQKKIRVDKRRLRQKMHVVMKHLGCSDRLVSLTFVDDSQIRELNLQFLKRDRPTNVLAFSLVEGEFGQVNPGTIGDIVISVETALLDAERSGIEFYDELAFLMIHGLLHLLDYDHENVSQARKRTMKEKERELFYMLTGYRVE